MMRLIILLLFISAPSFLFGQAVFQRSYGAEGGDYGRAVIACQTGGYAIVGSTNSYQNTGTDIYLLRVDEMGDYMWGKSIGDAHKIDWGIDIAEDVEGNFIIAGYTNNSPSGAYNGLLIKTNSLGDVISSQVYGDEEWAFFESMVLTENGEIILAGQKMVEGHQQGWLIKADATGEVIWEKLLQSSGELKITGLDVCENGSIVFSGYATHLLLGTQTFVAGNYTQNGSKVWVSSYPQFGKVESGKCICGSGNTIYAVSTRYYSDDTNDILVKSIDAQSGSLNWRNHLGVSHAIGNGVMQKANGDIFFCGSLDGYGWESYSASINTYNALGGISEGHTALLGGFGYDELYDIIPTSDGGHIAVGETNSFGNNYQVHLCKIDSAGTFTAANTDFTDLPTSLPVLPMQPELNVFPNPAQDKIYADFEFNPNTAYRIFTYTGKEVKVGSFKNTDKKEIDISRLESGMYILTFYENEIPFGASRFIKLP